MGDDAPLISAVLISWNRAEHLKRTVESLRRQGLPGLEIIVIDNGSGDESLDWLRKQDDIHLIENGRNLGACRARNQGTRAARGRYVLYMDSDAEIVTPGGLTRLAEQMDEDRALAGMGGIIYENEDCTDVWCVSPTTDWEGNYDPAASVKMTDDPWILSTCFCLMRRDAVVDIGGFDEFYFYLFEDGDLCLRLRKAGWRFRIDPDVKIVHYYAKGGRTERGQIDYHYYHERIRFYYVLKNMGIRRFWASCLHKWGETFSYRQRFPYMPLWRYIDLYCIRALWMLVWHPWILMRRKGRWV